MSDDRQHAPVEDVLPAEQEQINTINLTLQNLYLDLYGLAPDAVLSVEASSALASLAGELQRQLAEIYKAQTATPADSPEST